MTTRPAALLALARAYGVQPWYRDAFERRRDIGTDTLVELLRALGAPLEGPGGAEEALRARTHESWTRPIEPVIVAWDGEPATTELRVAASQADERCELVLRLEDGSVIERALALADVPPVAKAELDGSAIVAKPLPLPRVPLGYHRLAVRAGAARGEALVIAAPTRAPVWSDRVWGAFVPLHAVRSARDWGCGDLGELREILRWIGSLGGRVVATLPLLATFLDVPFEPSPYAPVSRLFWSELLVDVEDAPEFGARGTARAAADAAADERATLRAADLVDYRRVMAVKRRVLDALAQTWAERDPAAADAALRDDPALADYARFRARTEAHGPWPGWPADPPDAPPAIVRTYAYAQRLARAQLASLADEHPTLQFDLPLGVHPLGYDAWRHREVFADGVSAGAPPDGFFTRGQDWTFAPLHPERLRDTGYAYPIACLRHLLSSARVLRIDHVMGMHRMWWIPAGASAEHGAYVRHRPDEWYALMTLEASRRNALVVGEDLGTVPSVVRRAMARHGMHRTYVVQEELDERAGLNPVRRDAVAALNTHDMPPFAAFTGGLDIDRRVAMGLLDHDGERVERDRRHRLTHALAADLRARGETFEDGPVALARVCLRALGRSRARAVVPALEDLWGETEPQNIPGTAGGANWRRKAALTLEEMRARPDVRDALRALDQARRGGDQR